MQFMPPENAMTLVSSRLSSPDNHGKEDFQKARPVQRPGKRSRLLHHLGDLAQSISIYRPRDQGTTESRRAEALAQVEVGLLCFCLELL